MAGSWGGPRPGAGAKKLTPEQKAERRQRLAKRKEDQDLRVVGGTDSDQQPKSIPAQPKQQATLTAEHYRALSQAIRERAEMRRGELRNPFEPATHPPEATPSAKANQMAMDSALSWGANEWVAAGMLGAVGQEGLLFLGYPFLAELAQRPEYRTVTETIADDATRKGWDFDVVGDETEQQDKKRREQADPVGEAERDADPDERKKRLKEKGKLDKVKELKDDQDRLQLQMNIYQTLCNDGFFGRAHLYLRCKEDPSMPEGKDELKTSIGNGREPLSRGKVNRRNPLKEVKPIEPVWCYPMSYNATNPLLDNWYKPGVWFVMGQEIHGSRFPTFIGHPVPDMLKPAYSFGGLSLSQMAKPYIDMWLQTRTSVAQLIHSFSVMVLMTDMQTIMSPQGMDALMARVDTFNLLRDNQGTFVLNKATEDFKNVSASIAGLHELQAQSQEHIASVVRIPLVKYTGIEPTGLNASSEGSIMVYDDTIAAYQNRLIRPNLTKITDFEMLSLWNEVDQSLIIRFNPLRELTEKELAEKQKAIAERDKIYVEGGAISPQEWRETIIQDPELPYGGLDPEDVPDLAAEEEAGLEPEGGRPDPKAEGEPDKKEPGAEDAAVLPFAQDADFREEDHPRAPDGKFGSGSGTSSKTPKAKTAREKAEHNAKHLASLEPKTQEWHKKMGAVAGKHGYEEIGTAIAPGPMYSHKMYRNHAGERLHFYPHHDLGTNLWSHIDAEGANRMGNGGPEEVENFLNSRGSESKPPLKESDLTNVGPQMGSNPGGVYQDKAGNKFYIKRGQTKEHVKNEMAAAALYKLAGSPTLNYRTVEGGNHIATEMTKLDKDRASKLSPEEIKQARQDFVTHAWLANYDAVGTGGDNLGTVKGVPTALDLGGSLLYRARGAPKGEGFGSKVPEIDNMRNPKISPDAAKVFGGMTPDELKASAEKVTKIPDDAIRETIKASGLPDGVASTLIARKQDIAKRFGIAMDEKDAHGHEHAPAGSPNGGQFVSQGGSSGGSSSPEGEGEKDPLKDFWLDPNKKGEHKPAPVFKSKKEHAAHLLQQEGGVTTQQMLTALGWPSISMPAMAKTLGMKLEKTKVGGVTKYKGTPMTAQELKEAKAAAVQKSAEAKAAKPAEPSLKEQQAKIDQGWKDHAAKQAAEAAKAAPKATPEELKKAAKATTFPSTGVASVEAKEIINEFNAKYANKPITDPAALNQKVADFKKMQQEVKDAEDWHKAKEQAAAAAKAKAQAEEFAKQAQRQAEKNKQVMAGLGISEKQAEGVVELAKMLGSKTGDIVGSFQKYAKEAESYGYPITGFQCALIHNYSDGGYAKINQQLRFGAWTPAQHAYVSMVNKALLGMPKHKGEVIRNTDLTPEQLQKYIPGHITQEHAFLSTSTGSVFSGNVQMRIQAIGKRGASIKKLSNHSSENEVLFAARTFFKVNKIDKNSDGQTVIHMEEWEED